MNERILVSSDGTMRRAFTVADVERMVEVGLIDQDERLEIVDGEILPMSPKGPLHETVKIHLNRHLALHLPAGLIHAQEPGWHLGPMLYLEPDFLVFPERLSIAAVTGPDAALVVEVADTSFRYDAVRKAEIYASIGVREYWLIDTADRSTRVHRDPQARGYRSVVIHPSTETLNAAFIDGYRVRLRDLPEV